MRDDQLVMAEWYDLYIPQRHHMQVMTYYHACMVSRTGVAVSVWMVDPEMLRNEQATATGRRSVR